MPLISQEQYEEYIKESGEPEFKDYEFSVGAELTERDRFYETITTMREPLQGGVNNFRDICHNANVLNGWWHDPETKEPVVRNVGELIALMHSELSEALEGYRKGLKDEHLPQYDSITVELADAIIRIFDCSGALNLPVGEALVDKLLYNAQRADHKPENRTKEGGKKF